MENNKKINKSGSVTIPAHLRRNLGIEAGDRFQIEAQGDGKIVLKRTKGSCIFCKADDELSMYMGRLICRKCLDALKQL